MFKWLYNNIYIIGIALILSITSYFFFIESITAPTIIIAVIIMAILSIFVLTNKKVAIYAVIALAPLSIPLYIEFMSLELSFPTEFLTLLLIITLGCSLFLNETFDKKIIFHPLSIILLIDIGLTLISTAFSTIPLVSVKRLILKMGFISIFYFVFSHWFLVNKQKSALYFLYAIGLIYPIYSTLKWHSLQDFSVASSFAMPQPFYSDHTIYGACLAFILPFLISWVIYKRPKKKVIYTAVFILTIFILIAEVLSYSRASWISLFAVIGFCMLLRFKVKITQLIIGIGILIITLSFNYETIYQSIKQKETNIHTEGNISDHLGSVTNLQTDASNLERINRWVCAIRMFNEKPITGYGPGTYQFEYGQFQSSDFTTRISTYDGDRGNAHSEYLTYLSEYGLLSFILFLILIFYSLHIGLRSYYYFKKDNHKKILIIGALCGLITFYIHGLFNSFIDSEKMAILIYGSLSILVLFDIERKKMITEDNL